MEKSEFCVLIKHYFLREKKPSHKLDKYHGDSAPSISMVKKWFTEFQSGRTSTEIAKRSRRPVEVFTSQTIKKIHGFSRPVIDNERDFGSHRHFTWLSGFNFE
jgi:hypothetical protein